MARKKVELQVIDEQLVFDKRDGGVDYGGKRRVLLLDSDGKAAIWITKGHKGWCSIGQQTYYETRLEMCPANEYAERRKPAGYSYEMPTTLIRGGHMTQKRYEEHARAIVEFVWGEKIANALHMKKTVAIKVTT